MTPIDNNNDQEAIHRLFREIQLGDALGDDGHLIERLPEIESIVLDSAPPIPSWLLDGLCKVKAFLPAVGRGLIWSVKTVEAGIKRYTDTERRRILSEAEAHKTVKLADSQAGVLDAQAELTRAQARRIDAESKALESQTTALVEEERAKTKRKNELWKELQKSQIKWIPEYDHEGKVLRVLFSKGDDSRLGEDPEARKP